MNTTKIRKIGNSMGVLLPASLLDQLHAREGDTVSVTLVNGAISVRPMSLKTQRLLSRSADMLRAHRDALQGVGRE